MMKRKNEDEFESVVNLANDDLGSISSEKEMDETIKGTDLVENPKTKVDLHKKS